MKKKVYLLLPLLSSHLRWIVENPC
jgi:hypothetical protein